MSTSRLAGGWLAVLLLASAVSAQATHKDTSIGFSFKPPKDFKAIALTPGDTLTVAKYQSEQTDWSGEGGYNTMFSIQFFPKGGRASLQASAGGDGEALAPGGEEGLSTLEQFVTALKDGKYAEYECTREKTFKLAKSQATELHFESPEEPLSYFCVALPQDDGTFLFEGSSLGQRFGKASSTFLSATNSFKRIDREDDRARKTELSQMDEQERFLQQQIDKLPPGWSHMRTKRYLFLYDTDKAFAQELADRIEAMRDVYETHYPPDKPIEAVSIVRVCATLDEYHGYGGPPGTGGYWYFVERELVLFDFRPRELTLAVLNHEAFHQYIFYFYGELSPHSWYNEGTGDFYAGAKLTKTNRVTGYGDAPGGIGRLGTIKEAARLLDEGKSGAEGACPPLKSLMKFHQSDYYGSSGYDGGICYAAGWAVVHFLREGKGLDPKWQKILPDYLLALVKAREAVAQETMDKAIAKAEKNEAGSSKDLPHDVKEWYGKVDEDKVQDRAFSATFTDWKDSDWATFQDAWLRYVEKL